MGTDIISIYQLFPKSYSMSGPLSGYGMGQKEHNGLDSAAAVVLQRTKDILMSLGTMTLFCVIADQK